MVTWSGLVVVALFVSSSWVIGLPIPPPDLTHCQPIRPRDDDLVINCCLPTDVPVKEFTFPDAREPVKIRRNAATLDAQSIEKYNQAYLKMRALPPNDPRSFTVQSNIHCGYCSEVFKQQNSSQTLEIHRNWLLLPFHRWYVYFHERILASLIDDAAFAIPFWNWDNQSNVHHPSPNAIPEYFYSKPGLLDLNRNVLHMPPNIVDLHWGPYYGNLTPPGTTIDDQRILNNQFLYTAIVSGSAFPEQFLGGQYRYDEDLPWAASLFEMGPHASVHYWVGSETNPHDEDMGPSYTAARDPLFFSHHSNVDRLFQDWHALGGRRSYPTDRDWLNASFLFYDEQGELVRVTVAQSLEMDKLRYAYEPVENSWMEDPSIPLSNRLSSKPGWRYRLATAFTSVLSSLGPSSSFIPNLLVDIPDIQSMDGATFSSSAFHARVTRPHATSRAAGKLDHLEEVLVIHNIWAPAKKPIWFEIFINFPEANEATPLNATEWCGRFSNGPHLDQSGHMNREAVFSISIGEKLRKLGIVEQPSLVVSLVPKGPLKHKRDVRIQSMTVELR